MYDWNRLVGWTRHCSFGLREEWLQVFIESENGERREWDLGIKQVESLARWVKTIGLKEKDGSLTEFGSALVTGKLSIHDMVFWEIAWVNAAFSFPTAKWYVHSFVGSFTTRELREKLSHAVPRLTDSTVRDAVYELTDLLRKTPIGTGLKQGIFSKFGNVTNVVRNGIIPSAKVALYAIIKLFAEEPRDEMGLDEELTWPWVIFNVPKDEILRLIVSTQEGAVSFQSNIVRLMAKGEALGKWLDGSMLIT